jgi:hypothetical protein
MDACMRRYYASRVTRRCCVSFGEVITGRSLVIRFQAVVICLRNSGRTVMCGGYAKQRRNGQRGGFHTWQDHRNPELRNREHGCLSYVEYLSPTAVGQQNERELVALVAKIRRPKRISSVLFTCAKRAQGNGLGGKRVYR